MPMCLRLFFLRIKVEYAVVFIVGIISSIAGALLGIGGGIIIVPALVI